MKYQDEMKKLNMAIAQAEKSGLPAISLYKKQLEILQSAHDEFISRAVENGYNLKNNLDILEVEIKQFTAMKQIAQKIGMPTAEFDAQIRAARVRVLGEEVVKAHFD